MPVPDLSQPLVLLHSEARPYREELFTRLARRYPMKFLFFRPTRAADQLPAAWEWDYRYLAAWSGLGYNSNIAAGLIPELFRLRPRLTIMSDSSSFASHAGFLYCLVTRTPYVLFDEQWRWPKVFKARLAWPYVRTIIRRADALVAAGTMAQQFFVEAGADAQRIHLTFNAAVDMGRLPPKAEETSRLLRLLNLEGKTVILFAGRMLACKGLDGLLCALKKVNQEFTSAALVVVGEGEKYAEWQDLARRLGLSHVVFTGAVAPEKMAVYYHAADILVHPARFVDGDIINCESWGMVINEAMSAGLPVIATKAAAAAYDLIAPGKNGFLLEPDDVDALARHLLILCRDPGLRKSMGQAGRRIVREKADYQQMAEGFARAIDAALANSC